MSSSTEKLIDHTVDCPEEKVKEAREELEKIKKEYNYIEPDRGNLDDENIKWRVKKPDYTIANLLYFKGKTKNHAEGSLEHIVENAVKMWEMEGSHKVDINQWQSINPRKYTVQSNGGRIFDKDTSSQIGNYNWLMEGVDKSLYDSSAETFESSHQLFRGAFPGGFAWEVLEVYSGPPKIAFSWRHWANFTGNYKGRKGNGDLLEMFGFCIVTVQEDLKILSIEAFFKPELFLKALEGNIESSELRNSFSGCPIKHKK